MEKGQFWWLLQCPLEYGLGKSPTSLLLLHPASTRVNQPGPPYRLTWVLCAGHASASPAFPTPAEICFTNSSPPARSLLQFNPLFSTRLPATCLTMSHTFPRYCIRPPHLTLPSFWFSAALVTWYVRSITWLCLTLVTPWTVARQVPLSIEFSRQEYWSGLPFPPPRDLPKPEIELASPALAGRFFTDEPLGKPLTTF